MAGRAGKTRVPALGYIIRILLIKNSGLPFPVFECKGLVVSGILKASPAYTSTLCF